MISVKWISIANENSYLNDNRNPHPKKHPLELDSDITELVHIGINENPAH